MNPHLFVYGTLQASYTNPFARFLHENATFLGEAKMPGAKMDLGQYPGAKYMEQSDQFVFGQIFLMSDPGKVLSVLDEYECIGPAYPEPHQFIRKECHIFFKKTILKCWVYLYNWPFEQDGYH